MRRPESASTSTADRPADLGSARAVQRSIHFADAKAGTVLGFQLSAAAIGLDLTNQFTAAWHAGGVVRVLVGFAGTAQIASLVTAVGLCAAVLWPRMDRPGPALPARTGGSDQASGRRLAADLSVIARRKFRLVRLAVCASAPALGAIGAWLCLAIIGQ